MSSRMPCRRLSSQTIVNCSGCGYGNALNSTPLTALKMAVFATMPSASVSMATRVKPGFFTNIRVP